MKKSTQRISAAAILALSAIVAAAVGFASCSVGLNPDVLAAVNPKQTDKPVLTVYSGSAAVTDDAGLAVSLTDTYDLGYSATSFTRKFTITNTGTDPMVIYTVTSDQSAAIAVSEAPPANTVLAPAAATAFTLSVVNPAIASEGTITVYTSDANGYNLAIKTYGGGPTIDLALKDSFSYRLDGNGYDFGYANPAGDAVTRTLTLTNSGKVPVAFATAPVSVYAIDANGAPTAAASTAFAVSAQTAPATLAVGAEATIGVSFDSAASTWSESAVTLKDKFGRSFRINLTGSGFKQPLDVTATVPALWLRADRIKRENTLLIDAASRVTTWPDASGNGLSANAVLLGSALLRPVYNSTGINGMPSITFSGNANADHLQVYKAGGFLNTTTGVTAFIAFKTGVVDGSRYILQSFYTNNTTEVFPRLMWEQRNIDTGDGYYGTTGGTPLIVYPLAVYGYGLNTTRHLYDTVTDWESSPSVISMKKFALAMKYDVASPSCASPNANIFTWMNGDPHPIGFIYSYSGTAALNGAWGYPVGNGTSGVNPAAFAKTNDYSQYLDSVSHTNSYFYNRVSASYNSSIAWLNIGATSSSTSNFRGEIAEILLYASPLSDTDIATINAYLNAKYDVH